MAIHEFAHVAFAIVVAECRILVAARTELVGDGENGVDSAGTLERILSPEPCFLLVVELHDQR
jgi:hypothetical protein